MKIAWALGMCRVFQPLALLASCSGGRGHVGGPPALGLVNKRGFEEVVVMDSNSRGKGFAEDYMQRLCGSKIDGMKITESRKS